MRPVGRGDGEAQASTAFSSDGEVARAVDGDRRTRVVVDFPKSDLVGWKFIEKEHPLAGGRGGAAERQKGCEEGWEEDSDEEYAPPHGATGKACERRDSAIKHM